MVEPVDIARDGFAWREAGSGSAVVFLHGLGGNRTAWEPQLRSLGTVHRCAAWDMPGYGGSDALASLEFPALADAVVRWLDAMAVDRAVVVGLSMGGMIAQHVALDHPDRVGALVLVDTSPAFGLDGTVTADEWLDSRLAPIAAGATPREFAEAIIDGITGDHVHPRHRAEQVAAFAALDADAFTAACRCLVTHDVLDRLPDVSAPTLVVVGADDAETPPSYARAIATRIPGARLEVIAGAGHLAPAECPTEFNALVGAFVGTLGVVR